MASSLARLGAALPRAAARALPPGRWAAAVLGIGASRRAERRMLRSELVGTDFWCCYAFRCQVHSDIKVAPTSDVKDDSKSETRRIKMLYDGDCPLCMREVNMLRERNKSYGAIKFVDISSKDYSPDDNQGLDYETVMGKIHAILSDGTVITDVEVATMANAIYGVWAKYRMQITVLCLVISYIDEYIIQVICIWESVSTYNSLMAEK
ncbi:OSJNBa0043A12.15-like protein [Zea mays]|uniref:OSJNBa0043A12.15-like protein n=1 Tax=Zea mays TaxID=4577 RepID=A0A1D6DU86_MAIZE|nr:OSJNBa0043A12.15-like protein [Zea mays]